MQDKNRKDNRIERNLEGNPFALINLKYTIHRLAFQAYQALTRGLATHGHEGFTMRGMEERIGENDKKRGEELKFQVVVRVL